MKDTSSANSEERLVTSDKSFVCTAAESQTCSAYYVQNGASMLMV